jgi:hypothetical protein
MTPCPDVRPDPVKDALAAAKVECDHAAHHLLYALYVPRQRAYHERQCIARLASAARHLGFVLTPLGDPTLAVAAHALDPMAPANREEM